MRIKLALLAAAALALAAVASACPSGDGGGGTPAADPVTTPAAGAQATPSDEVCISVTVVGDTLELSGQDFALVDGGMQRMIEQARANDVSGATATFLHEVHSFTHVIDTPLREHDAGLGERLWNAVAEMEGGMVTGLNGAAMADQSTAIRGLLQEAAVALGCTG
jgi:hypothetical protein